jgi:hypothetical protein
MGGRLWKNEYGNAVGGEHQPQVNFKNNVLV